MHQKRRLAIDLINNDLIIRNYITYNIRDLDQDQNRNRNSLYMAILLSTHRPHVVNLLL